VVRPLPATPSTRIRVVFEVAYGQDVGELVLDVDAPFATDRRLTDEAGNITDATTTLLKHRDAF
jgi:hypothetical protein